MIKLAKSALFVAVRAIRCAWVLTYSVFFVVAMVQLHALIVDPVAIPHIVSMITSFNPFA